MHCSPVNPSFLSQIPASYIDCHKSLSLLVLYDIVTYLLYVEADEKAWISIRHDIRHPLVPFFVPNIILPCR